MSIFTFLIALVIGLLGSSFAATQSQANDTESKNDINLLFQKLEEHYAQNGDYPTAKQLSERGADVLPGIDPEALTNRNGIRIWEPNGLYSYEPSECGAIGCQSYEVGALLKDGTTYSKQSLN